MSLRALGEAQVPASLASDLGRIERLPEGAQKKFWDALGPSLAEPLPADVERKLDAFASLHEAPREDLARALKAARYLVREATKRALDRAAFEADVVSLIGQSEAATLLSAGYEQAKEVVAHETCVSVLRDQGAVVTGCAWRVDTIEASSRGGPSGARVGVLTMNLVSAGNPEVVTVQLTEAMAREIGRFVSAILQLRTRD